MRYAFTSCATPKLAGAGSAIPDGPRARRAARRPRPPRSARRQWLGQSKAIEARRQLPEPPSCPVSLTAGVTPDPPSKGASALAVSLSGPLQETQVKGYTGPLTTLGNAATAKVRLIVWCRDCQHRVEPDPAEHAARYGADLPVRVWVKRLKCSRCGSRSIDFVLTGARR